MIFLITRQFKKTLDTRKVIEKLVESQNLQNLVRLKAIFLKKETYHQNLLFGFGDENKKIMRKHDENSTKILFRLKIIFRSIRQICLKTKQPFL